MGRVCEIDGIKVEDGKVPLTLNVRRIDAARASRKEPDRCAVARACYRELHATEVRVHLSRVYVRTNGTYKRYCTPPCLRNEIIAFDRGGQFAPGQYTLTVPGPARRLTGKQRGGVKTHRVPTGRKRRKPHVVSDVRCAAHS